MPYIAIDPATGHEISRHDELTAAELRAAITSSHRAYLAWRTTSLLSRGQKLRRTARLLRERAKPYAELMALEMGKPLSQGMAEIEKCALVCEYYAEQGHGLLTDEQVPTDASRSYVTHRPLGIIFAIMPWNFPFWQVIRFAAPALMGGNAALLKHAQTVPGCALAIEALLRDAGFPEGTFRTLLISHQQAKAVIRHRHVAAVTLTGSNRAGKAIGGEAGRNLKKHVLELGGSDPYVILADADLDAAVEACATSRLINSGQSCIAAKRFIVVESIREQFEQRLVTRMARVRMGHPLEPGIEVGPQARVDLRDALHVQVRDSLAKGARLLLGGKVPPGPGAFYPPTVLGGVKKGMPAYRDELFGPVAAVIGVRDMKAAIRVANDTTFGLGAAVFTRDVVLGERIASESFEAGSCFVNAYVRSDPRLPFGGIRESGHGRELGRQGLLEFQNVKTVYVG